MAVTDWRASIYGAQAERMERDPINGPGVNGRATVPMGRGFDKYRRFHPGEPIIYVDDADGKPRGLTRNQYRVLQIVLQSIADEAHPTMRDLARALSVSASTVSRAMWRLASWGLIGFIVGRGRHAGMLIFRTIKGSGLEHYRTVAKARVARWSEAAKRRLSRLEINVATYILGQRKDVDDYYYRYISLGRNIDPATTPWTVQELREAGIL